MADVVFAPPVPVALNFIASGSVAGTGQGTSSGGSGSSSNNVASAVPGVVAPQGPAVALDITPTAPQMLDIERDFDDARLARQIANDARTQAGNYVAALTDLATNLVPPTITPVFPEIGQAPVVGTPTPPTIAAGDFHAPQLPAAFAGAVPGINSFPQFTSHEPTLLFPNAPQAPSPTLPSSPGVDLNFTYPTVDVSLPPVPDLLSIDIQRFDGVTFPTLSATAPVLTAVAPSVVQFVPNAPYTDALLQSLTASLKTRIDIGNTGVNTGLPPIVEQNLWNREREREARAQLDALTGLDKMEAMGYAFPPGTFIDARIKIQNETAYSLMGSSREIAIAQAKLEQDNIKMALETTVSIEGKLIDAANQAEQRRFEAAKYATEAGISLYNAQVQAYSALVQAYRAAIDVYTAQINGARAEVELYTAQVAAEKLKVEVNTALIEQYRVRVDAALASIKVFEGEISLIKTRAEVEQIKVSIFGEQVRAYAAEAQLYQAQVEGYKATIEAENTKEQVYATSANVYSALVGATAKEIDARIAVYKAQLDAKSQEVEVFKAAIQGEAERVRAIASANQSTVAIYSAEAQAQSSYNEALIKEYQASIDISEKVAQIGVAAAEANGKLYISAASVATDAAKVGAQVEAQIAASALGAVTFATHRARQDSTSFGTSVSYGQSKSISQSGQTSQGTSTTISHGTSTSLSSQVSSSTSFNTNVSEAQ